MSRREVWVVVVSAVVGMAVGVLIGSFTDGLPASGWVGWLPWLILVGLWLAFGVWLWRGRSRPGKPGRPPDA